MPVPTLLIEPFGGLAGDMLLAALLDLGDPRFDLALLEELADALVPGEARLARAEVERGGMRATHLSVRTPETGHAPHRHLGDLLRALERAPLGAAARGRATGTLRRIAEAEAEVHGVPLERVHFHEVGAVDTLIDVAGACLALERLEVLRVLASPPLVGSGMVRCAHGTLPVPAPATALLLRGLPQRPGGEGERLTPTGAALLAELADGFDPPALFRSDRAGYGAGAADYADTPNLVRVQLGEGEGGASGLSSGHREAWLCEVTLDDTTGEELGFLLDELYAAGALEAWTGPVAMKKGRPGVVLTALCRAAARSAVEAAVFGHTPSLGLRWTRVERAECERATLAVEVEGRSVRVKVRRRPGARVVEALDLSPEHDDLADLARATGRPLRELEARAIAAARARLA